MPSQYNYDIEESFNTEKVDAPSTKLEEILDMISRIKDLLYDNNYVIRSMIERLEPVDKDKPIEVKAEKNIEGIIPVITSILVDISHQMGVQKKLLDEMRKYI